MIITKPHKSGGTEVKAGEHTLAIFTEYTEPENVAKFVELAEKQVKELTEIGIEYEEKRAWNFASKGNGKNWPIFSIRDKFVERLKKQAGIIDS